MVLQLLRVPQPRKVLEELHQDRYVRFPLREIENAILDHFLQVRIRKQSGLTGCDFEVLIR